MTLGQGRRASVLLVCKPLPNPMPCYIDTEVHNDEALFPHGGLLLSCLWPQAWYLRGISGVLSPFLASPTLLCSPALVVHNAQTCLCLVGIPSIFTEPLMCTFCQLLQVGPDQLDLEVPVLHDTTVNIVPDDDTRRTCLWLRYAIVAVSRATRIVVAIEEIPRLPTVTKYALYWYGGK